MMFYFGKYLVLNMYYIKDYIHDKFFNIKLEISTRRFFQLSMIKSHILKKIYKY